MTSTGQEGGINISSVSFTQRNLQRQQCGGDYHLCDLYDCDSVGGTGWRLYLLADAEEKVT